MDIGRQIIIYEALVVLVPFAVGGVSAIPYSNEQGPNFVDDADKAYIILLNVFPYLSRKDLQTAAGVCKVWNLVGTDNVFWKEISLKNCIVHDIDTMIQILIKGGTEKLDLRGMSFFKTKDSSQICSGQSSDAVQTLSMSISKIMDLPAKWSSLCKGLAKVTTLIDVTMDECPPRVFDWLAESVPQLISLSLYGIDESIDGFHQFSRRFDEFQRGSDNMGPMNYLDLTLIKNMKNLLTLKLQNKRSTKLIFNCDPTDIIELNLKTLTISRAINLSKIEHILPPTLVSLELGKCDSLSHDFCDDVFPKLVNLTRLRLESCVDSDVAKMFVHGVPKLPNLSELELINFAFPIGIGSPLAECTNLKSLLIIPMYSKIPLELHTLINQEIKFGTLCLKNSLHIFIWVVTDQLISFKEMLIMHQVKPSSVWVSRKGKENIPFISRRGDSYEIDFSSFDFSKSVLMPNTKFILIRTCFPSTWNLNLKNIRM